MGIYVVDFSAWPSNFLFHPISPSILGFLSKAFPSQSFRCQGRSLASTLQSMVRVGQNKAIDRIFVKRQGNPFEE